MSNNSYRQRIAVQDAILNYVQQLIVNNDLSARIVEEALNKTIVQLQPFIIQEALEEEEERHHEEIHNLMHQYNIDHDSNPPNQEEVTDG